MANNFDDFNYDDDDVELNDEGLPVEDDEDGNISTDDMLDYVKRFQDNNEDNQFSQEEYDEDEQSSNDENDIDIDSAETEESGGRYGDKSSPTEKSKLGQKQSSHTSPAQSSGGDDWFSKLTNKFGKGGGGAGAKAGGSAAKAGGKAAGQAGSAITKALASIGPYGWLAILVILLLIIAGTAIAVFMADLEEKSDPANMSTNSVITSEYFYGTRSVYIDEDILTNELQLSYKQYIIDVVENFEENNPSIDVTIEFPTLTEGEKLTNETLVEEHITNLSLGIANIVATGSSDYLNIDFVELYPQIPYFGLTAEQCDLATSFIVDYIVDNSLYSTEETGISIEDLISTTITEDVDLQYILNRTEKVMIRDGIATESGIEGIEIHQYIAHFYMPNKDIVIESCDYIIATDNMEFNVISKLIEENNGTTNIIKEHETTESRDFISGFTLGKVTMKKFTNIDENNLNAFSVGLSLFSALRLSAEYKNFFTINNDGIYTWKPTCDSLYYLTFETETPFIFGDYDINIKLP